MNTTDQPKSAPSHVTQAKQSEANSRANLLKSPVKGTPKPKLNSPTLASLLCAFMDGATIPQAMQEAGTSAKVTRRFVDSLRYPMSTRCLYVCGHEGRNHTKVYKIGQQSDVPPPTKLTQAERAAAYRARKKAALIQQHWRF